MVTLTIITQNNIQMTINPGAYQAAVTDLVNREFQCPGSWDAAYLSVTGRFLTITDNSTVRPSQSRTVLTLDRAALLESRFRQIFPAEFNQAEVAAVSAAIVAQN